MAPFPTIIAEGILCGTILAPVAIGPATASTAHNLVGI